MSTKFLLFLLSLGTAFTSCAQSTKKINTITKSEKIVLEPKEGEAVATFASGCFWCVEEVFESLVGVREVISGYAGGSPDDANYQAVSNGSTQHAESVQIYYNPSEITFETLTAAFFASHDPTTLNQQGPDRGPQYRSVAFYRNDAEKTIILNEINKVNQSGQYSKVVVTQVDPFEAFYPAEDYHQNYVAQHPNEGYVKGVSVPRFEKFKREFKGNFKKTH